MDVSILSPINADMVLLSQGVFRGRCFGTPEKDKDQFLLPFPPHPLYLGTDNGYQALRSFVKLGTSPER